jgi:hypothetical protein
MDFIINPLVGIHNGIKFGMNFMEIRKYMKGNFKSFIRGGNIKELGDRFPCDFYQDIGVFFYYDLKGKLEAIEFAHEAKPVIDGQAIFDLPAREAVRFLAKLDPELLVESDGATSFRLSLGLWAPDLSDEESAPVESFLTGRPGYYDKPGQ